MPSIKDSLKNSLSSIDDAARLFGKKEKTGAQIEVFLMFINKQMKSYFSDRVTSLLWFD